MEWRIRESSHGGYIAERGIAHQGGTRVGLVGVTMPAFIVYESSRFPTLRQAERYVKEKNEGKQGKMERLIYG